MVLMLGSIVIDVNRTAYNASYNRDYENAKAGCAGTLQNIFTNIANAMGENTFVAGGDEPTWIDFSLYESSILID